MVAAVAHSSFQSSSFAAHADTMAMLDAPAAGGVQVAQAAESAAVSRPVVASMSAAARLLGVEVAWPGGA